MKITLSSAIAVLAFLTIAGCNRIAKQSKFVTCKSNASTVAVFLQSYKDSYSLLPESLNGIPDEIGGDVVKASTFIDHKGNISDWLYFPKGTPIRIGSVPSTAIVLSPTATMDHEKNSVRIVVDSDFQVKIVKSDLFDGPGGIGNWGVKFRGQAKNRYKLPDS